MTEYQIAKQKNFFELNLSGEKINLIEPKSAFTKKTGLLNHCSLETNEGLIYKNTKLFHTFGMNFPISVICMDNNFKIISQPLLIQENHIFVVPKGTKYTLEINSKFSNCISNLKFNKKIHLISEKSSRQIFSILKYMKYFFILFFLCLITFSVYAQEDLKISLGKTKVLNLEKPPLSIQVSDPDIIQIERIGITNSIKIIPKQEGESLITVIYPAGEEVNWNIQVGNNAPSNLKNLIPPFMSGQEEHRSSSLNHILVKNINKISGLKASDSGEKIIIIGELNNFQSFTKLSKIISPHTTLFYPAYNIPTQLEKSIISFVQSDLELFGERNLKIINHNGIFTLTGVPTSPAGKSRAWNYLAAIVPNIVDSTSINVGESAIVQINLDFLELSKGEGSEFGFNQPLFKNMSATFAFPAGLISQGIIEPSLQIGPISTFFKSLQNNSYVRELAKPVVITRSGEKASFLAGGEVPIVTAMSSANATTSSVTYKPFGILFHVTPRVQVDGSIWIKLDLEVSQISEDLSYQNIPGFTSRKINTSIILNEGNTALLSGLVQNKDVKQVKKIPILGSIPIIGELFKSRRFQENNTELWVAITAIRGDLENRTKVTTKDLEDKFKEAKQHTSIGLLD